MNWIENEMKATSLPDSRLKTRMEKLLSRLSELPQESIPANSHGQAGAAATYRFFDNHRILARDILSGHKQATIERIAAQKVVLLVQDTTQLTYEKDGGAIFDNGTIRRTESDKYWLHPVIAFTAQRVNLGSVYHEFWQREKTNSKQTRKKREIEDKESMRWLRGYDAACAVQKRCPETCVISVADRECDIYDFFLAATRKREENRAEYLIRANANRRLATETEDDEKEEAEYLRATMNNAPVLGRYTTELSRTPTREARTVEIEVRAHMIQFCSPRHRRATLPAIELYVVQAREIDPPKDEEGVNWLLLTSLPVENFVQAQTIIGYYKARWEIELYFRTLKSGSQVEELRLETDARLENAVVLYMIIAWHLHNTTMLARETPEANCELVFTREEWRMIYALNHRAIPEQAPNLRECVRVLAQVGGFLARKGDGEPGMKTIWRGYVRVMLAFETIAALNACRERKICV